MRRIRKCILTMLLAGLLVIIGINAGIKYKTNAYIFNDVEAIPDKQVVIVLGAFVRGDNLSMVLEDRVQSGIMLYHANKAGKLLLSGDHGHVHYDEVNGMRRYVLADEGIAPEDIFLDHAGFDTYDTMYRAKEVFGVESAIIVTQDFHINRAVYIAQELGIDVVGYSVDEKKYRGILRFKWHARECLSRVKAYFDVAWHASPKYLGQEIPITGDGQLSWDEFDGLE